MGGDLGVGKSVIREILNEFSRQDDPPLTPPKRGIIRATPRTRINKMKIPIQSTYFEANERLELPVPTTVALRSR